MKFCSPLLALLFALNLGIAQPSTQDVSTYEEEISHLRGQIEQIIYSSQKSLEEADAKLLAARQRIRSTEEENKQLRAESRRQASFISGNRRKLADKLEASEASNQFLISENRRLQKQLAMVLSDNETEIESQAKVSSLEKKEQKEQRKQQEKAYEGLERQFILAGNEIIRLKAALQAAEYKSVHLQTENSGLWDQSIKDRERLDRRLEDLSMQMTASEGKVIQLQTQKISQQQLIDSLHYELTSKGRMIAILNQADKVERERLRELEQNERYLNSEKKVLESKSIMLATRERQLEAKMTELAVLENKYNSLLYKEKQLKMLEQRLKQQELSQLNYR